MLGWNLKGLPDIHEQAFVSHNLDQISLKVQGRTKVHLRAEVPRHVSQDCLQVERTENDEGERENHCYCASYRPFEVKTGEQLHFGIVSVCGDEIALHTEFKLYDL